jgi:hypothetical protein
MSNVAGWSAWGAPAAWTIAIVAASRAIGRLLSAMS